LFAKNVVAAASFDAPSFRAAIFAAVFAVAIAIAGRVFGSVTVVDPNVLYSEGLHKSPWTFKKDAIFRAGQHFNANAEAIALKGTLALIATGLLVLEVAALAVWLFW
jgi:hypothetical protein